MPGLLPQSPQHVFAIALVDMGLANLPPSTNWPVYANKAPDAPGIPDNIISVHGSAAIGEGTDMISGERNQHHGILIRVRASKPDVCYTKANAIADGIQRDTYMRTVVIGANSYLIHKATLTTDVVDAGNDGQTTRVVHTVNAIVSLTLE